MGGHEICGLLFVATGWPGALPWGWSRRWWCCSGTQGAFGAPSSSKTLDARFRAFSGTRRPNPDVVVVALDQKSINFYRRKMQVGWPWPRSFYQILVD